MRTHILATLAMALIGSAGCVGGLTDAGPPNPGSDTNPDATPRQQFDSTVAPLLVSERCAGCHVGPETGPTNMFLGVANTNDSFYAGITGDAAINGKFNPIAASILIKGQHEGPKWSAAEAATISDWLDAESAARGTGSDTTTTPPNPTNPALSVTGAEEQWAACLSISQTEFTTTKAYAIADMQTDSGRCYSCHEPGGAGGAYWGRNNQYLDMLSKWQTEVFITGAFQAQTVSTGGTVSYKMAVASNKICSKGKEQDNSAGTHPKFDCNQNVDGVVVLDAMASFATMVQAKADAHACPTPAFLAPGSGGGSGSGSGGGGGGN